MILQMVSWLGLIAGIVLLVLWAIRGSGRTPAAMSSHVAPSLTPWAGDRKSTRQHRLKRTGLRLRS